MQASTPQLRVLVVEDNRAAREMLHSVLELEGHLAASAADGQAALELLESQPFDIALVDIGLPEIDGYELARRIRSQCRFDGMFLIALTGHGRPEDRQRAVEAGFNAHLVKPLDFAQFSRIVAQRTRKPL